MYNTNLINHIARAENLETQEWEQKQEIRFLESLPTSLYCFTDLDNYIYTSKSHRDLIKGACMKPKDICKLFAKEKLTWKDQLHA